MPDTIRDNLTARLARRLPRRLLYWATVTAHSKATTGPWSDTECPADAGTILRHLADGTSIGGAQPPLAWRVSRVVARLLPHGVLAAAAGRLLRERRHDEVVCQTCSGSGLLLDEPAPPLVSPA